MEVIRDLVEQSDISLTQKIYLLFQPVQDGIVWCYTSDGNYITTTQDTDIVPPPLASSPGLTKMIWSSPIPLKLKHFCWKIGCGIIAVKEIFIIGIFQLILLIQYAVMIMNQVFMFSLLAFVHSKFGVSQVPRFR